MPRDGLLRRLFGRGQDAARDRVAQAAAQAGAARERSGKDRVAQVAAQAGAARERSGKDRVAQVAAQAGAARERSGKDRVAQVAAQAGAAREPDRSSVVPRRRDPLRTYGPWVAVFAILNVYPWVAGRFWSLNGAFVAVFALIALSLTVLTGWTGPVSLAQAAFVGLGAFLAAVFTQQGINFVLWIPLAALASVPASMIIGLVARRLPGLYFAVVTLAFGIVAQYMIFVPVENAGITQISRPVLGVWDFRDERLFFLLVVVIVAACFGVAMRVGRGRTGRAFLAIRKSETAAEASGIDVAGYRLRAFIFSGVLATIAGVLLGTLIQSAVSNQFTPFNSIEYLAITIIGGIGSVLGAVFAGLMQVVPRELMRPLVERSPTFAQFTPLLTATLLVLFVTLRPDGFTGLLRVAGIRLGLLDPRPPRELAFLQSSRGQGEEVDFELGEWHVPPGSLGEAVRRGAQGDGVSSSRWQRSDRAPRAVIDSATPLDNQERVDVEDGIDLGAPPLSVRDVSVTFGAVEALSGIDLTVEPGEIVGIIGPNGAGKTTLFNVISGLVAPEGGRVVLDGRDVTRLRAHERAAAGIGRTFQTPRLIDTMSAFENLLVASHPRLRSGLGAEIAGFSFGLREEYEVRARVDRLMRTLGLEELRERAASDLPSGLLKILEVTRAVMLEPHVLLLDEPSAGLDPGETRWLGNLIRALNAELDISIALIEHDMSLVMNVSDYIYVFESGELLTAGPPDAVRTDPQVIAAYLGEAGRDAATRAGNSTIPGDATGSEDDDRCAATTESGDRCSRAARQGEYCAQHRRLVLED